MWLKRPRAGSPTGLHRGRPLGRRGGPRRLAPCRLAGAARRRRRRARPQGPSRGGAAPRALESRRQRARFPGPCPGGRGGRAWLPPWTKQRSPPLPTPSPHCVRAPGGPRRRGRRGPPRAPLRGRHGHGGPRVARGPPRRGRCRRPRALPAPWPPSRERAAGRGPHSRRPRSPWLAYCRASPRSPCSCRTTPGSHGDGDGPLRRGPAPAAAHLLACPATATASTSSSS